MDGIGGWQSWQGLNQRSSQRGGVGEGGKVMAGGAQGLREPLPCQQCHCLSVQQCTMWALLPALQSGPA